MKTVRIAELMLLTILFILLGIIERIEQEIYNLLTECRTRDNSGICLKLNDNNPNDFFVHRQMEDERTQRKRKAIDQQQNYNLKLITKGTSKYSSTTSATKSPKVAPKDVRYFFFIFS